MVRSSSNFSTKYLFNVFEVVFYLPKKFFITPALCYLFQDLPCFRRVGHTDIPEDHAGFVSVCQVEVVTVTDVFLLR